MLEGRCACNSAAARVGEPRAGRRHGSTTNVWQRQPGGNPSAGPRAGGACASWCRPRGLVGQRSTARPTAGPSGSGTPDPRGGGHTVGTDWQVPSSRTHHRPTRDTAAELLRRQSIVQLVSVRHAISGTHNPSVVGSSPTRPTGIRAGQEAWTETLTEGQQTSDQHHAHTLLTADLRVCLRRQ